MPSILVLEEDPRSLERIHHILGTAGWRVRAVHEPAQALQAAQSERPDLVIVGAAVAGAGSVAGSFSRRSGGPGVLGLLPPGTGAAGPFGGLPADELLAQPFSDQELLAAVQRAGTAPRAATSAPRPQGESKLTSADIFGDVLAEMELADDEEPAAPPASVPQAAPEIPAPAAVIPASAPRPAPPRQAMDDDLNRKLEQTLSGVFGSDLGRPRPAAPAVAPPPAPPQAAAPAPTSAAPPRPAPTPATSAAAPARKPAAGGGDDIDAILNRTLGIGASARPRPAAAPAAAAPAPPAESTSVRKAPKATGLSELEELTRTFRNPAAAPPRPVAVPPAPAAAPPPAPVPEPPAPPALDDPLSGSIFGADPFDLTALELPPLAEPVEPAPAAPPEPVFEPDPDAPFDLVDLESEIEVEISPEPVPLEPEPPPPLAMKEPVPEPAPAGSSVLGGAPADFAATQRIAVVLDDTTMSTPGAERFGQYTLLEKIAAGGMAEVWKARMSGVEGFQKTVAIKKILPHMTDNSEFIGMFIDEAKLAAQLSHPNIVHIYDLGKIGRDYYIAMEYVEGKDLRSLLNASRRRGVQLSLGLSLLIASRLASALDYAHRKRDFEGKELALVHRDVSPQNVLLTREGDVKLCDFGIAKAVSKAGQTQMGSLKGKLQYMSPEQAWGRPVDGRSDIFSLGAVLFEMLTGERLFSGESEMSILEAVRQGKIRSPREIDPSIPVEVDEIVTRALGYDVRDRFQSAGEMMQRIDAVLHTLVPSPGPGELAGFLERLTAPEPSGDVLFLPTPPAAVPPSRLPDPEVPPSLFAPAPPPAEMAPAPAPAPVEAVTPVGDVHVEETGGRRSRLFLFIAIAVLLVAAVLALFFLRGRRDGEATPPAATEPQPAAATPAPPQAAPVVVPPAETAAPEAEPIDVNAILKEELAKREKKIRSQEEARIRQLEQEVAKAKKEAEARAAASEGQPPPPEEPRPPRPERD